MENEVYGAGMVFYEEPIAYVLTLSMDRKRLEVTDIVNEERYQLLQELIGSVDV